MQQVKYIDIDSSYRDRSIHQNPAKFDVEISNTGMKSNDRSTDPVTNAYPDLVFRPDDFTTTTLTIDHTFPVTFSSNQSNFVVKGGITTVNVDGYYVGAVLIFDSAINLNFYRIVGWKHMYTAGADIFFRVIVEGDVGELADATTFQIKNPSDIDNNVVFFPNSVSIDNYYCKYKFWRQSNNQSYNILSYDGTTHLAKISSGIAGGANEIYVVRLTTPSHTGSLDINTTNEPMVNAIVLTGGVILDASYLNAFIRIYNNTPAGTIVVGNTRANMICKIVGFVLVTPAVVVNGVVITPAVFDFTKPILDTSHVLTTDFADVKVNNSANYNFEVMPFTKDNKSPFVYSGSLTTSHQPVAHEITLNSLILPNVVLLSGGIIANYPYVYVEFENITLSSSQNILYSNNPMAHHVMFKVPITDLNHPTTSRFVKLTGNGMVQTVSFRQNDSVRVVVRLPSGEEFKALTPDTEYGQLPNPFLQVSFCFGMKRL